jgi:dTDP-4-dehydrorhamnose 3,5-epimerase
LTIERLPIEGLLIVSPERIVDERGWFARMWDVSSVVEPAKIRQQSVASNARAGTVRGMHVAVAPAAELKIVRCTRGSAFDVIVDARRESPTCGKHVAIRLDSHEYRALVVPPGCAHGYQTLVDQTDLQYDISEDYRPEFARGFHFADAKLGIDWPLPLVEISQRDASLPSFADFLATTRDGAMR